MASKNVHPKRGLGQGRKTSFDLVTVATYSSTIQAEIGRAKLTAHGIRGFVADEHLGTMNPQYIAAAGGIRLQVKRPDAEAAQTILSEPEEDEDELIDDSDDGPACPACGKRYVYYAWPPEVLFLSLVLLGLPLLFLKKPWHCRSCDHRFHQEPEPPGKEHPYRKPREGARVKGR